MARSLISKYPISNKFILTGIVLLCLSISSFAQDTRTIVILPGSRSLRQIQVDSATTLITLAGNASIQQGRTFIYGDSIAVNQATGIAEVFGNVHINDADTVDTYSQYLKYMGNERIAYLKRNVKLTDGKATLLTDDLVYNLGTGIANYKNGGKVLNGKTVLTSSDAVYYSDTKDVYFKKYVHLTDPQYDIKADSLLYNTQFKIAHFISPTTIVDNNGGTTKTSNGFYNLQTGVAELYDRTSFSDSNYFVIGGKIAINKDAGIVQIENNGKIVDSANNITMLGNLLYLDKKNKTFLGTKKPVLIIYKNNDSTYVAADTLFSGVRLRQKINVPDTSSLNSTKSNINALDSGRNKNATENSYEAILKGITEEKNEKDTLPVYDSLGGNKNALKTLSASVPLKSTKLVDLDSLSKRPATTDSIRYFLGFRNVRIFNDSLQAVCDSVYYSTEDSVFRMFRDPVFWNAESQVSGDTMYLFTEKQKAKRLYVFTNGLIVNKSNENMYNQIGGRTLNAYFLNGSINYVRTKGSPAESIYYPQDEDSAYIGMNRTTSDVIDAYFEDKKLVKVKWINNMDGKLFRLSDTKADDKKLKNFLWEDKRRPKNKLELFE